MKINKKIHEILTKHNIYPGDGLTYLLSVYFSQTPTYIPEELERRISITKIFEFTKLGIVWNVPLFEEQLTKFEWVAEYREAFKRLNKTRAGTLSTCVARMKTFFVENPDVRLDEVKGAVNMYLRTVTNSEYLISAHKFIYEGTGVSRNSPLEGWIEQYRELQGEEEGRNDNRNTIE